MIDMHIARRMKQRREDYGISQKSLGEAIALTYQQIQKYESVRNRVPASTLWHITEQLQVPIGWFFEGVEVYSSREKEVYQRRHIQCMYHCSAYL